jgi:lysyl-tRNA synthetase class 2
MQQAAQAIGAERFRWMQGACDVFAPVQKLRVAEAFHEIAGIRLHAGRDGFIADAKISARDDDTRSDLFSRALVQCVEPFLGANAPTILSEYPIEEAALARRAADPRYAKRFELYVCGVELANGYDELTDPAEQRARLEEAMAEKQRRYGYRWPIDEDFLAALAHMPPASGVALGFDRLVMLATGARFITDVLWTPE